MKHKDGRIKGKGRTAWGQYKLTPEQRAEIRRRYVAGRRGTGGAGNAQQLAREFGVDMSTIHAIGKQQGSYAPRRSTASGMALKRRMRSA